MANEKASDNNHQASTDFINIQEQDFDVSALNKWLQQSESTFGAIVTFTGVVRNTDTNNLDALYLEHYPGMTEKSLQKIVDTARNKFSLARVAVVHRIGELRLNDNIVFVGVSSAHRVEAFEASQFIMDYLKKDAPFWKKEKAGGEEHWVEQKQSDLDAASKW